MSKTLGWFVFCLLFVSTLGLGKMLPVAETINMDPAANIQRIPKSFCITADRLFLMADYNGGTIKAFSKEGSCLKFVVDIGRNGIGTEKFSRPMYCFYCSGEQKLGVVDFSDRQIYVYDQVGKLDFKPIRSFPCRQLGDDFDFTEDGRWVVVSGYFADSENRHFDLYGIGTRYGRLNYLLPSFEKYHLKDTKTYISEYHIEQTIPAIGKKGFIDIDGDYLYMVWEGSLRIIKVNLLTRQTTMTFEHEAGCYSKPDGKKLSTLYKKGDFKNWVTERKKMAYVTNVFTTSRHVFLIYEIGTTAGAGCSNSSNFRMQIFSPAGEWINEIEIGSKGFKNNGKGEEEYKPGKYMYIDEVNNELYAIAEKSKKSKHGVLILKYDLDTVIPKQPKNGK